MAPAREAPDRRRRHVWLHDRRPRRARRCLVAHLRARLREARPRTGPHAHLDPGTRPAP